MGEEAAAEIQSGLTWRSFMAIVYAAIVFLPASLWLYLTIPFSTSVFLGVQTVSWMTFILFEEIFRRSGNPLTRQEATMTLTISSAVGEVGVHGILLNIIYHLYYKLSPYAIGFGIADKVPWWSAPLSPLDVQVWDSRTFFDPALFPILVLGVGFSVLRVVANLSMGLLMRRLYVEGERLQFPIQLTVAEGIETVVSRKEERFSMLTFATIIGILYGVILYVPFASSGGETQVLPVPWFDFNEQLHVFLPGASFGLATSAVFFASGLVLPFNVVVSGFLGSAATWLVGNWLLVSFNWTTFAQEFIPGMNIYTIYHRSWLHVWALPFIGVTIAGGVLPILRNPRIFIASFRGLKRASLRPDESEQVMSIPILLALWLGATLVSIFIVYLLVPGYPVWLMLVMSVAWALVFNLASTRSVGEAGVSLASSNMFSIAKYGYIALSGYSGVDIWFINPVIAMQGPTLCAAFKVCDVTRTSVKSYIKSYLIMYPLILVISVVFVSEFWRISAMPSVAYPTTVISWPIRAINDSLWFSGRIFQEQFDPNSALYSFLSVAGVYVVTQVLRIPFSIGGLVSGLLTPIPVFTTQLIGGVFGKLLEKRFGRERWTSNKMIVAAGLALGDAMVIVVSTALLAVTKSLWLIPY